MTAEERSARTAQADELCRRAYRKAGAPDSGVALVAVGGYGRGELAPFSDLDVVLVSEDGVDVGDVATHLWYPLWDAGYKVDHSVRTVSQMVEAADADPRVALGLLDLRHLAGDTHLALRLRTTVLAQWRRAARERLAGVGEISRRRHAGVGELAHLSVPDLKEAAGGLRDATVLRALVATWLVDVPHADLERCRLALLDVRDHVHTLSGRAVDRVQPELWGPLAESLGLPDAEAAQRHVRAHGRRLAHLTRLTWQRVAAVLADVPHRGPRRPQLTPVAPGVAVSGQEVVLDGSVAPGSDPALLLRAAAVASERQLVLSPVTAARLVKESPALGDPWPAEARGLMVRLLAGPGLLAVWETLEETGALESILPEWEQIRLLPHASAIHRFTVDRHVVEACLEASKLIRGVDRPDLLLVTALLHDIGKGTGMDHSVAGEGTARQVALRMGFRPEDAEAVATLVRWHLLLPELATARDIEDPVTIEEVTSRVQTPQQLALLASLTQADALAASAKAWSKWRASLVGSLVARATLALEARQAGEEAEAERLPTEPAPVPEELLTGSRTTSFTLTPHESGVRLRVVARDRVGLMADVATVMGLLRVSVRGAHAWSQPAADGAADWAFSDWEIDAEHLDAAVLRQRFEVVARGEADTRRLERIPAEALQPSVAVRPRASRSATVLEVRAGDFPGLLHQVLGTVARLGMTVRSAHVDTVGPQAVDVFYLCELGAEVLSETRAAEAAHAVRAVLTPTG